MSNTTALLIEHHFKELYKKASVYAHKLGHHSPQDAASEAISAALRSSSKFEGDISKLTSYILAITHYKVKDYQREYYAKDANNVSLEKQHDTIGYCDDYFKYQYLVNIKNMTRSLTASEAKAIIGKYVYDYSDFELADLLDLTPGSVRVRRSTGISKIRQSMAQ